MLSNHEKMQMNEITFLDGKVRKQALAVFEGRPPVEAPRLKRLMLSQGELAQVHDGEPGIQYLACLELRKDTARGNHYHKAKNEFLYLLTGKVLLVVENIETKERTAISVAAGDLLFIPVQIAHGFRTIESGLGIEFSMSPFDPVDIYSFPLIGA
jgi:mannose-6-phosphate isomerase-like protein (cupin superfamily)